MEQYIAFDSHKRYTWVEHWEANTGKVRQYRVEHAPGAIREALAGCAAGMKSTQTTARVISRRDTRFYKP
jgi:hypothetical protein